LREGTNQKKSTTTMGKQTKRERKFNTSGGVKGRLSKGTITRKGKLKGKKPKKTTDENAEKPRSNEYSNEIKQKREDGDFTSTKNLGDLDMESFFATAVENPEEEVEGEEMDQEENDEDDASDEEEGDDDDEDDDSSDDDDDDDDENDQEGKEKKKGKKASPDSEDSDSEDEDLEAAEKKMQAELEKLEDKDPEFHQFLQENDEELLEYDGVGDDDDEGNEPNQADNMEEDDEEGQRKKEGNTVQLTPTMLEKLETGTFKAHGIKSLKKFVNAFKSACHLADGDDGEAEKQQRGTKYLFENSEVFDRLMVISLTRLHEEFHYHLIGQGATAKVPLQKKKDKAEKADAETKEPEEDEATDINKGMNPKVLEKSRRWAELKPILLSFFKSSNHILSAAKEPDLVVFVLKSLADFIPYMSPFPRLAESMLKTLTALWSAPIDASEDYQVVRLHSFLRIRQLALTQPFPYIEECLKKCYLAYAQRAKFANASSVTSSLPTLTFMGNCVVELYSLDYHSSYQHAFVYIRQMALHLRTAMQKKTQEALGAVYCWQYLHCLKLWVAVLAEACQDKDDSNLGGGEDQLLRSLIFPLTQIILGTARLVPSARYLPLRLHCVRLLQQLTAAAEIFLPTTSILLDVFDMREFSLQPKKINKSNVQPLALTFRLGQDNPLRTMEELEMCISEVFVLLNREADLYQYSAGFPEFSVRICQRLRKVCCDSLKQNQICRFMLLFFVLTYVFVLVYIVFERDQKRSLEGVC
jgi:nucleolar complex protein 2